MSSLLSRVQTLTRSDTPDDKLRKEMEDDKEKTKGGASRFKIPEDGKPHLIRVLPGFFGKSGQKFYMPLAQHWIGDGKKDTPFYCNEFHFGKPCAACEALADARAREKGFDGPDEDLKDLQALIKGLLVQNSWALNIVARSEIQEGGAIPSHLFTAPRTIFQFVESTYANEGPGILDLETGHDFIITRSKDPKTQRTKYDVSVSLKATAISKDIDVLEDMLGKMTDLDNLVIPPKESDFETAVLEMVRDLSPDPRSRRSNREEPRRREPEDERPTRRERDPEPDQARGEREPVSEREPEPARGEREPEQPRKGGKLYEKLRQASRADD